MSLAAATREAVRERPFLLAALRAGVVNYTATAEWLADDAGLDGDREAVATALRRFGEDLSAYDTDERRVSVSMRSGVAVVDGTDLEVEAGADVAERDEPILRIGDAAVVPSGRRTAIVASGDVDAAALAHVLDRLSATDIDVDAAGVAADGLAVVVGRRSGADAVRVVESALDSVPSR